MSAANQNDTTLLGPNMGQCRGPTFHDLSPTCRQTWHLGPKIGNSDIRHAQLSAPTAATVHLLVASCGFHANPIAGGIPLVPLLASTLPWHCCGNDASCSDGAASEDFYFQPNQPLPMGGLFLWDLFPILGWLGDSWIDVVMKNNAPNMNNIDMIMMKIVFLWENHEFLNGTPT